jgi:diguanylate cyclase
MATVKTDAARYEQSRERSAEVLRTALAFMGQHDAAFNPVTFTVWYEHAAGINAELTRAIEQCVLTEPRLGDGTIVRLYRDHVAAVDELAMQRASAELQRVMSSMAESAAHTGLKAGLFSDQLSELTQTLRGQEAAKIGSALSQTLAETAEMKDSAAALQRQVVASRQEIDRLRSDLNRARDEALVDPLTRVVNRRGFDGKLQDMFEQAPVSGSSHCLVMFDIDRFKAVNDTCGHVMGDRVLQGVAEALGSGVQDPTHCLARYGGEEFALLLPQCSRDAALALAESCRERVKAMKVRDRRTQSVVLSVTISAGVTALQPDDDAQSFIARADGALYAAKQAGRDRVICA